MYLRIVFYCNHWKWHNPWKVKMLRWRNGFSPLDTSGMRGALISRSARPIRPRSEWKTSRIMAETNRSNWKNRTGVRNSLQNERSCRKKRPVLRFFILPWRTTMTNLASPLWTTMAQSFKVKMFRLSLVSFSSAFVDNDFGNNRKNLNRWNYSLDKFSGKTESLSGKKETFSAKIEKGVKDRAAVPQTHRYSRAAICERTRLTRVIPKAIYRPWSMAESAVVALWGLFVESTEMTYRLSRAILLAELRGRQ